MRRQRWQWAAGAVLFVVAVTVAVARRYGVSLEEASWVAAVLAVAGPAAAWAWRWTQRSRRVAPGAVAARLDAAAATLTDVLLEQWRAEEATRRTWDPWPLPVRWRVTERAQSLMGGWSAIRGDPDNAAALPLSGTTEQLPGVFTADWSPQRLVLLPHLDRLRTTARNAGGPDRHLRKGDGRGLTPEEPDHHGPDHRARRRRAR